MLAVGFVLLGLSLFLIGLAHQYPVMNLADQKIFLTLNRFLTNKRSIHLFRTLWPLGTTPVALVLLTLIFFLKTRLSLTILLIYICAVMIERIIKRSVMRPRPFITIPGVVVSQPRQPTDPSFPSGDALRAWFFAVAVEFSFEFPWYWLLFVFLLAFLVTLGRIALGVHYPLDVVGGMGLGFLFAGVFLLCATLPQLVY